MPESSFKTFLLRELPISVLVSGLFVGGYFALTKAGSDAPTESSGDPASHTAVNYSPNKAAAIVSERLPQVAVIGTKAGPNHSSEVFIQVPGVLNMQSVYVLSDNKTVISGFILPQMDGGAIPGGQMTIPDGHASVNPRKARPQQDQIRQLLQGQMPKNVAQTVNERRDSGAVASPVPMPQPVSATPPTPDIPDQNRALETAPHSVSSQNPGVSQPEPLPDATPAQSDAPATPDEFKNLVQDSLKNGEVISKIRNSGGDKAQQQSFLKAVQSSPSVTQGAGPKELYIFFDPNCPVCHKLYDQMQSKVGSGQVTLHWIPAVVFSNQPSSMAAATQMLAALDQDDGSALGMLRQVMSARGGASQLVANEYRADRDKPYIKVLADNTALMTAAQPATPLLVYKNHQGDLELRPGIPSPGFIDRIASNSN